MNSDRADHTHSNSREPFQVVTLPLPAPSAKAETPGNSANPFLPPGWRRLATGRRGTKLYRVTPPGGGVGFWVGEMEIDGKKMCRRFAGELHARAWLTVATDPLPPLPASGLDFEEINGPFVTGLARA